MAELRLPFFGHGGDYNPDQWLAYPEVLKEDIRLMKLSGCNLMSVGIFAWAALEPEEGVYTFDWLEKILDDFAANGIYAFLATPSGARPAWMSAKYPEVLRVRPDGHRNLHGARHNHCFTSPVYREKVRQMNTALAKRFGHHPAVVGWHISNEYSGECHCDLCQNAFRDYLKETYGTLDKLNAAWWTGFWSKTYTDWDQLHSPVPSGETGIHGLNLAWKRFVTLQTADFIRNEIQPLKALTPHLPVTTNLMYNFTGLDYSKFTNLLDFTSFDNYPMWGSGDDEWSAVSAAMNFDKMRALLQKPWALMESTPSQVNWQEVCKLKKPGMHLLSSLQAVAHGADTVQYFQWRKGRGASEKFHGAVVDHVGHEHTRTFREVTEVGDVLKKLAPLAGMEMRAQAALIWDIENGWALEDCQGPRRDMKYLQTVREHYLALSRQGVNIDVIDSDADIASYKLIAAPMLYMIKPGVAEKLDAFVKGGGILICTCRTGCVDKDDLCFPGGFPGPLRQTLGIWAEETDALWDEERNGIRMTDGRTYTCSTLCDLIHPEGAEVLGTYTDDFYAGMPAVTKMGGAYYIATRPDQAFLDDFYAGALKEAGIACPVGEFPTGVQVTRRGDTVFVMNFNAECAEILLPDCHDLLNDKDLSGAYALLPLEAGVYQLK